MSCNNDHKISVPNQSLTIFMLSQWIITNIIYFYKSTGLITLYTSGGLLILVPLFETKMTPFYV